jgi:penicillin-binding protein 1A
MTTAYGIFPSGGIYTESSTIVKILDAEGNTVIDNKPRQTIAIREDTAQAMVRMMKSVINYGTAYTYTKKLNKLKLEFAGKTGTTDNNYDKWFIGYSPYYAAGVWIGYDQPQDLGGTHGHIQLWDAIMADIHTTKITSKGEKLHGFSQDMLIKATFCKDSGKLMSDLCKNDPRGSRSSTGYFTKDTLPTEKCDVHIEVKWCKTCNAPAHAYCPSDSLVTKIMLSVDRSMFPADFKYMPTDTDYVYNPLHTCICHYNPDYIPPSPENPDGTEDTEGGDNAEGSGTSPDQ